MQGETNGTKSGDREIEQEAEIQHAQDQQVQGLRAAAWLHQEVQALQDMLPVLGQQRNAPWRHEVELVGS
jgi:hypothetical protein